MSSEEDRWLRKIKMLSDVIWERRVLADDISRWLANFRGEVFDVNEERRRALHLLQQFLYYDQISIRVLLRALFRDVYRAPLIHALRIANSDTRDIVALQTLFAKELSKTVFLGVGNPSESGPHLLYYFRQENKLSRDNFSSTDQILEISPSGSSLRRPDIQYYIYIDDLCGSGEQVERYLKNTAQTIKFLAPHVQLMYFPLFATTTALRNVIALSCFDRVEAVVELDDAYKCFSAESLFFKNSLADGVDKAGSKSMFQHYGAKLNPAHPLGYRDSQLLIGFSHNIPDNTLPVIWKSQSGGRWESILKRYGKF